MIQSLVDYRGVFDFVMWELPPMLITCERGASARGFYSSEMSMLSISSLIVHIHMIDDLDFSYNCSNSRLKTCFDTVNESNR